MRHSLWMNKDDSCVCSVTAQSPIGCPDWLSGWGGGPTWPMWVKRKRSAEIQQREVVTELAEREPEDAECVE